MLPILNGLLIVGLLISALLTVRVRGTLNAVIAFSAVGTFLALLFLLLQAPDVALSEAAVGAVATPMALLIALAKIKGLLNNPQEIE